MAKHTELLAKVSIFNGLEEKAVDGLSACLKPATYTKDALIVGAGVGVPLKKRHAIGRHHVELQVSAGGDSIELSPLPADTTLGLVKLPMSSRMVRALVLIGPDGKVAAAYDAVTPADHPAEVIADLDRLA